MRIRFNRLISVICAIMILISAVSVWAFAEESSATPTDLTPEEEEVPEEPAEEQETEPEKKPLEEPEQEPADESEEEPTDEAVESLEVIVTKTLTMGQSWEGKMKKTKPAVLKLDLNRSCTVYMLVEGRDVWATVEKSDRLEENPARTKTDSNTGWMMISWPAEEGSYLITLGPVEPNLLAAAKVTFMDKNTYDAWEAAQVEAEPEPEEEPESIEDEKEPEAEPAPESAEEDIESEEETETDPEPEGDNQREEAEEESDQKVNEPKADLELAEEDNQPEETELEPDQEESEPEPERHITVDVTWDVPNPAYGDTAHFMANLEGYEELNYTIQWQYALDKVTWYDLTGETNTTMDVVVTEQNNLYYWRIMVYVEEDQED